MQRALFFPHHTEQGCSDNWQKPQLGCLRCRALKKDQDEALAELLLKMARNQAAIAYEQAKAKLAKVYGEMNPP